MNSSSERPGEFALIAELFAPLARNASSAFGLTDDAAIIAPPAGHELVITADTLVEGVHFLPGDPAASIAKKALRVNLSDLAAKGADAIGYLLALSLPRSKDMDWLRAFASGLAEDQNTFGVALYGGDTTSTPGPLTISVTAFGFVPHGTMIRRAGAKPGDLVFVSGTIGDAGGGLDVLRNGTKDNDYLADRYREPQPRLKLGYVLREWVNASIDVSDGLLADLGHIAEMSNVRIEVEASRIPLSPQLRALWGEDCVVRAATCGDDYEIALAVPYHSHGLVKELARGRAKTPITEIGRVTAGQGVVLIDEKAREIPVSRRGFTHF
ncbi:MAG TPA: thiamine-phosphate kinase [Rhizomicrobium sp.]|jgi:thiamine-monophosphate kinase|nr:thiamine-phosphate kinase [Rhizomicrobium sp.]